MSGVINTGGVYSPGAGFFLGSCSLSSKGPLFFSSILSSPGLPGRRGEGGSVRSERERESARILMPRRRVFRSIFQRAGRVRQTTTRRLAAGRKTGRQRQAGEMGRALGEDARSRELRDWPRDKGPCVYRLLVRVPSQGMREGGKRKTSARAREGSERKSERTRDAKGSRRTKKKWGRGVDPSLTLR